MLHVCAQFQRWLSYTIVASWGRVKHICFGKLTNIGSDNGLPPGRRQAIIWTNAAILLIGPLGTNFSEILIVINTFLFKKMRLKMSSAKWRSFCLGLNVLRYGWTIAACSCLSSYIDILFFTYQSATIDNNTQKYIYYCTEQCNFKKYNHNRISKNR